MNLGINILYVVRKRTLGATEKERAKLLHSLLTRA